MTVTTVTLVGKKIKAATRGSGQLVRTSDRAGHSGRRNWSPM